MNTLMQRSNYLHIYVCMYVCMYACMHVCMYVRMYLCMHVCMYVCIMYVLLNICVYDMYTCMYVFMCICRCAQLYMSCMPAYVQLCHVYWVACEVGVLVFLGVGCGLGLEPVDHRVQACPNQAFFNTPKQPRHWTVAGGSSSSCTTRAWSTGQGGHPGTQTREPRAPSTTQPQSSRPRNAKSYEPQQP